MWDDWSREGPGYSKTNLTLGVRVHANARPTALNVVQKAGTTRFISTIRIVRGTQDQLSAFANRLLVILVRRRVLRIDAARRLIANFGEF